MYDGVDTIRFSLAQSRTFTSSGVLSYHCMISLSRPSTSTYGISRGVDPPKRDASLETLAPRRENAIIACRYGWPSYIRQPQHSPSEHT